MRSLILLLVLGFSAPVWGQRVACLGDSITSGDYVTSLAARLPKSGGTAKAFGFRGRTIAEIQQLGLQTVLDWHPTDVIVLGGTNNLLSGQGRDATVAQLTILYKALKQQGLRVVAVTIPPCRGWLTVANRYVAAGLPFGETYYPEVLLTNQWIKTNRITDTIVDLSLLGKDGYLLPAYDMGDHLHPSDVGQREIGLAIYRQAFNGRVQ